MRISGWSSDVCSSDLSSSVYGTIFIRGLREEYDRWRDMGNGGWGYEDVLPFFRKLEDFEDGDPRYRGRGGPISVERLRLNLPVTRAFIDACAEAGIPANGDYNGASIEGASPLQFNTRYGRRQSAAVRSEERRVGKEWCSQGRSRVAP